ncbi:hypothetical protein GCM10009839_25270 [Catenulispora yoronensis]|uniref:EF-hand domain-containing protein n=2 Tax=Catenulispora yoronensis TaxID=450799 RepID=A0ABN2TZB7_9ACTN
MRSRYFLLVVAPLLAVTLPLFAVLAVRGEDGMAGERLALCAMSAFFNVFIIHYHLTTPPHPKFLMLRERKFAVRVHVVSGMVELAAGIVAYSSPDPVIPATVMAVAALCGHVPSALYQTSIVFGAKAIMLPGYIFVISLHAFCAVNLLLNPSSTVWIVNTFLALNVYVWVRVFIGIFNYLDLFPDTRYSVAVMFSGFVVVPGVIGVAGNLLLVGFVLAHLALYKAVMKPSAAEFEDFTTEKEREALINDGVREAWAEMTDDGEHASEQAAARALFDRLDTDGNGALDLAETARLMGEWKLSPQFIRTFVNRHGEYGHVTFDAFYSHLYQVHGVRNRADNAEPPTAATDHEAARTVFEELDLDRSGAIDVFELRLLLLGWGLPESEADKYLRRYDHGDRLISFQEFYEGMRPIWRFGFYVLSKDQRMSVL